MRSVYRIAAYHGDFVVGEERGVALRVGVETNLWGHLPPSRLLRVATVPVFNWRLRFLRRSTIKSYGYISIQKNSENNVFKEIITLSTG